ncbi:FecR family protein [Parabacteroides sp. PF5-9]|uniref:FecR family protein n=1 Tax=Parabacteroides sp. PF5-9 TaxID=1742404 RepID=UPI0024765EAB|nr:FecR family protein [Parabacteroides sp. PF5-9]MDH6356211.1 transmembrane sensor [Parabacteroides sp. PF5-9]
MDDQLLIRFLTHRCSAEEIKQIDQWVAEDKSNGDWLFEMEQIWSLKDELRFSEEQEINRAYNRFLSEKKMHLIHRRKKQTLTWVRYGAAAVIIFLLSLNLYQLNRSEKSLAMNMIEVPKGEKVTLTLSDGTKVWLNAETRFTYPSQFGSKNREVELEGEAYFEVTKDHKKPFIVKGDEFDINVLGTQFNVSAHPGEDISIALKEGKISVGSKENEHQMILNPSDHLQLTTDGRTILQKADITTIDSWTKGEVAFTAQSLAAIVRSLERTFNVPIVLKDESLSGELFNCRAQAGTSLFDILELLRETRRMNYRFDNASIVITKN